MGILYLARLLDSLGVPKDWSFGAGRLVIDGSDLVYRLYFNSGLDQNLGGEYGAFKDLVTQFIGALRKCNIHPYVLFDGCADFSDQKWHTQMLRTVNRLQKAHQAAESGEAMGVLPTLTWEVFRQTLDELKVPLARCYTETDQQAAALAQEWGCPVLSSDSDFFIFPLTGGMLSIDHFRWQEVQQSGAQSFIPCKRYLSSGFCKTLSIEPQLLPVFAVLAGNDYTRNTVGTGDMRLGHVLQRISGFKNADPQEVFEEFLKDVSLEEREQRIKSLQEAADHYSLHLSSLSDFFNQDTLPPLPPQMVEVVPDWMRRPVTEAWFSSDFLDVLTNQRVGLSVVVDHKDKPSANQVSLPLRRVLYELLLGRGRTVEERDRDGLQVIVNKVQTDSSVSPQLSLQSLPQTTVEQRRQVLLNALGVNEQSLSSLPSRLRDLALPLAATCFWLKEATPPPNPSLLKALLIGWCRGDTLRKNADLGQVLDSDRHWLNQWQSCLRDSFLLNQLLRDPLPEPPMARLYNGVLVHSLLDKMKRSLLNQSYIHDEDFKTLMSIAQRATESPAQGTTAATVASDQRPCSSQSGRGTGGQARKTTKTSNASPAKMNPNKKSKDK